MKIMCVIRLSSVRYLQCIFYLYVKNIKPSGYSKLMCFSCFKNCLLRLFAIQTSMIIQMSRQLQNYDISQRKDCIFFMQDQNNFQLQINEKTCNKIQQMQIGHIKKGASSFYYSFFGVLFEEFFQRIVYGNIKLFFEPYLWDFYLNNKFIFKCLFTKAAMSVESDRRNITKT